METGDSALRFCCQYQFLWLYVWLPAGGAGVDSQKGQTKTALLTGTVNRCKTIAGAAAKWLRTFLFFTLNNDSAPPGSVLPSAGVQVDATG